MSAASELQDAVYGSQAMNYGQVVAMVILVHEWLLLLPEEIEFIWKSKRWSILNVCYVISRYTPFTDTAVNLYFFVVPNITPHRCKHLFLFDNFHAMASLGFTEAILLMRTYALYERSRQVMIVLVVVAITAIMLSLVGNILWAQSWILGESLVPGVTGCNLVGQSTTGLLPVISFVFTDTVVAAMTLRKAWQNYRGSRSPLLRRLYSDGILYFVYGAVVALANIPIFLTLPDSYGGFLEQTARCISATMACRVVLNLREAAVSPGGGNDLPWLPRPAVEFTTLHYRPDILDNEEIDTSALEQLVESTLDCNVTKAAVVNTEELDEEARGGDGCKPG